MGAAGLESLTNELFEQVVQHLNLDDIRNLRLTSRITAFKAAQDTFREFFRTKHVELRRESLQCFVKIMTQGGMGCLIDDLTLEAVVYHRDPLREFIASGGEKPRQRHRIKKIYATPEELEASKQDLVMLDLRHKEDEALQEEGSDGVMLRQAFSNIVASGKIQLKRLTLRVRKDHGDTLPAGRMPPLYTLMKPVFQPATKAFRLVMDSLRDSQLKIQALDVFHDQDWRLPEQVEANLPCDNLSNLDLATGRLGTCLSTLKGLSVSITDPVIEEPKYNVLVPENEGKWPGPTLCKAKVEDEKSYTGLSRVVELCRILEELSVVASARETLRGGLPEPRKTMRRKHMHHLAHATPLPHLRKLDVYGIPMQDSDLLTFLANHRTSLCELQLTKVRLEGSFSSVLSYITGDTMTLESICLGTIHEADQYILFRYDSEQERWSTSDHDVLRRWGRERKANVPFFSQDLPEAAWPLTWYWTLEEPAPEEVEASDDDE